MRKSVPIAMLAALSMLSVRLVAASAEPSIITVSANETSHPGTVTARISMCTEEDSASCYGVLRRVSKGETAKLDSFLSLRTSPLPSLIGELSITADGQSLAYDLTLVSGALPVASVAGSVPVTPE